MTGNELQHPKLVSGYLNGENNPAPGVPLSSPSGSIVQPYTGMVGGKLFIGHTLAGKLSLSSIGTLYAGVYQMVKFKEAVIRGQIVFWDIVADYTDYQVTKIESGVPPANLKAGVCLCVVSAGYYGFIQVGGRASVKFRDVLTVPGAVGSPVYVAAVGDDLGTADVLSDDISNPTWKDVAEMQAHYVGIAETAPAGAAISVVDIGQFSFGNRQ